MEKKIYDYKKYSVENTIPLNEDFLGNILHQSGSIIVNLCEKINVPEISSSI